MTVLRPRLLGELEYEGGGGGGGTRVVRDELLPSVVPSERLVTS